MVPEGLKHLAVAIEIDLQTSDMGSSKIYI